MPYVETTNESINHESASEINSRIFFFEIILPRTLSVRFIRLDSARFSFGRFSLTEFLCMNSLEIFSVVLVVRLCEIEAWRNKQYENNCNKLQR